MGAATLVSVEEYLALPEREGGYEYDEGVVIEMPTHTVENAEIQGNAFITLGSLVRAAKLDFMVLTTGFWLGDTVERIPDISLVRPRRLAAMEKRHGSRCGAPDIAIEVVSPSE